MTNYCDFCNCKIKTAYVYIPLLIDKGGQIQKSTCDFGLCRECAKNLCISTYDTMTRCFDPDLAMARIADEIEAEKEHDQEYADLLTSLRDKYE